MGAITMKSKLDESGPIEDRLCLSALRRQWR